MEAGTAEFRRHMGDMLRRVKNGESIVITDRGKPVARVIPFGVPVDCDPAAQNVARLVSAGLVSQPQQLPVLSDHGAKHEGAPMATAVARARDEGA